MDKNYVGVSEEPENDKNHWFVELGQPNADEQHSFEVESEEKAFEIQNKLRAFIKE